MPNPWDNDPITTPAQGSVFHLPRSPQQVAEDARKAASDARAAAEAQRAAARFKWEQEKHSQENIASAPPGDITKTGEDYLKTLPPNLALQVKAMADGRRAFPTGAALRNPEMQALVAAATQYDPSLDATNAATRVATRKDFTSGKSSQNITSLNTVLGHLGDLWSAAQDLHNRGLVPWNSIANQAASATGDPGLKNYQLAQQAAVSEMERAFRGAGGSEKDIAAWKESLSSSSSPDQFRKSMETAVKLLDSRLQAMGDTYARGMGKSEDPIHFLAPHAQAVYTALSPGGDGVIHFGPDHGGGPGGTPPQGPPPSNPLTPASGPTRTIADPTLSAQVDAMVNAGASLDQINRAVQAKNFPPIDPATYNAAKQWMAKNPGKAYAGSNITRPEGMNWLQRVAGSQIGAFLANMANDFTAGSVGALAGDKGKGALAAMKAVHPDASGIGSLVGGITGAGTAEGLLAARASANLARYAPRAADFLYGSLSGFNNAEDGKGASGAALGGLSGLAGGYLGDKALAGAGSALRGVRNEATDYLRHRGIPMTVGQVLGQTGPLGRGVKKLEDAATSIPGIGNMVEGRRMEGLDAFNRAAYNDGAAPVGETITATGQDGLRQLEQVKNNAYSGALDPVSINANTPQFIQDVGAARQAAMAIPDVNGAQGAAVAGLQSRIGGAIDPTTAQMSGRGFQEAYRGLARTGRERTNSDYGYEVGQVMRQGQDALASALEDQSPGAYQAFLNANRTNRNLNVLADAQNAARNQEGGLFTPRQLNAADANSATRLTGKVASATGDRPFNDLATYGAQVLPSKVNDSGTATRVALQRLLAASALIGAGGGGGYAAGGMEGAGEGAGTGLLGAALLAAGGSRSAQRLATAALLDRPDAAIRVGNMIRQYRALGGTIGAGIAPGLLAWTPGN